MKSISSINEALIKKNAKSSFSNLYIDLDLPSGTKWCTKNVGAKNPEDQGDFYAWGETETKNTYSSNTYCNLQNRYKKDKYTKEDKLTKLEDKDDPTKVNFNRGFSTPTKKQLQELIDNTDCEFVDHHGDSDHKGFLFKSKINDNEIFIPCTGLGEDSNIRYNHLCYLWSCEVNPKLPNNAYFLYVNMEDGKSPKVSIEEAHRYYGMEIRPVFD